MDERRLPIRCNEYFDLVDARPILDRTKQLFEYTFLVKKPLPDRCFLFEHFSNETCFLPAGDYPLLPANVWPRGVLVHRSRQFIPPGEYDWWMGLFDEKIGSRVRMEGTSDDRIGLGRIRVGALEINEASRALHSADALPAHLHRCRLPVYFSAKGEPVSTLERGTSENKAAVISVPKAGTYLLEGLLRELGFASCGLHLSLAHCTDYRTKSIKDMFMVHTPLRAHLSTRLVTPGQSIVGHIAHCLESRVALADFRKIFVFRNLRDVVVSAMRFAIKMERPIAETLGLHSATRTDPEKLRSYLEVEQKQLVAQYSAVLGWRDEPEVLGVSFERLVGDIGPQEQMECVAQIARHVGTPLARQAIPALLTGVIGKETMTYSGRRSNWRQYWNEDVERLFASSGIQSLNRQLGYSDEPLESGNPESGAATSHSSM